MTRNRQKSCKETENHSDIVKIHISSHTFAKCVGSALQHPNEDQPEFQIRSITARPIRTCVLQSYKLLQVICRMQRALRIHAGSTGGFFLYAAPVEMP